MAFEKGREKTGGRQKGTPNKTTSEMRRDLKEVLQSEIENIPELLNTIECPEKRIHILLKMMPYVFPKVKPIFQMEGEETVYDFEKNSGY